MNNTYFIVGTVLIFLYIVNIVRKKKLSIKESFWWVMASIGMIILSIFPYSIDNLAGILNVSYPPSLLFLITTVFLILINFRDSRRIAELQMRVTELGQELAIVKEKQNK